MEALLRYRTWKALQRDLAAQLSMRGMLVRVAEGPALFTPATLRLEAPDGSVFELQGQVVQVIPGRGTAIQFGEDAAEVLAELEALCALHPPEGADDPADPLVNPAEEPEEESPPEPGEPDPGLESLSVNEKRQQALRGQRAVRLLLIRDRNKTLHQFVLRNPGITLDEVEQFAKMPGVSPDALRMMAANPEWNRSTAVCRNLIKNPKTPLKEALELLNKLPMSDVRALAKSQNVRTAIQQAARRKVNA